MRVIGFLLVLVFGWYTAECHAVDGGQFKAYQLPEKFSLNIPVTWSQVPNKEVEQLSTLAYGKPGKRGRKNGLEFLHGFRDAAKKLPSLYIQVYSKGKLTKTQFKSLAGTKELSQETVQKKIDQVLSLSAQDLKAYDPSDQTLWTSRSYATSEGGIAVLTVKKLTSTGYISLIFRSQENDFKKNTPLFMAIARSLKIDAAMKFSPT